jgi:hypothetical protein
MTATKSNETVNLIDAPAIGCHTAGRTCVKETTDGRFAVVTSKPRQDGSLRLIKLFTDSLHARRYNFAIHGDCLGE